MLSRSICRKKLRVNRMDSYIFIKGLRLHAYHGVLEQERTVGNDYIVDAKVKFPVEKAMATDCVDDTINYAELASIIRNEMSVPAALLETVAGQIIRAIHETYPGVESVEIKLQKVAPPMSCDCESAGVEIVCDQFE